MESKIFPVTEYIMISCLNSYEKFYHQLKLVSDRITPERIADEQRKLFTEITPLQIFNLQMFPLFGRLIRILQMGRKPENEPLEKFQQIQFILNFWKRLARAYFNTGALTVREMEGNCQILPDNDVKFIVKNLHTPNQEELKKIKRTSAQLEVYSFSDECETRMRISDHGPYELPDGEKLIVREMIRLHVDGEKGQWPWSEIKATAPTSVIAIAFALKNMKKIWFNDWGTLFTDPIDYSNNISSVAILTREKNKNKSLGIDELKAYEQFAQEALVELYLKMTSWSRAEKIKAGALVYNKNFDRFTNLVGITDEIDWNLNPEVLQKEFKELVDKNGTNTFTPLALWIFRSNKFKIKNPTYFLRTP
ncbi:MAG: hypothetical protein EAX96_06940 [Candidatus Lokiarchaeota archaeon]|nr:hypothetical protein [Candidatus Lokiarchaeota archaeon]